jgi:hypothetical protein
VFDIKHFYKLTPKAMKKITFILGGLFLMTIALTSCKKDYTCECTTGGIKTETTLSNTTKKLATDACEAGNVSGLVTCELK